MSMTKSQRLASYVTYVSNEPDVAFSEELKRAAAHILAQDAKIAAQDAGLTAARGALEALHYDTGTMEQQRRATIAALDLIKEVQ